MTDPRLGGRKLLHDGRTVEVTVWLDTDETVNEACARIDPVVRGPERAMALVAGRELEAGTARALWAQVLPLLPAGTRLRHGGRCVEVKVFANTDASGEEMRRRGESVAENDRTGLWMVGVEDEISREASDPLWAAAWETAERRAGKEN